MKNSICINSILIAASVLIFGSALFGQDPTPPETQPPAVKKPQDMRTNVLGQLGLSRDQIQQIRKVNIERKPLMEEAQKRLREAIRLLDETIYSDQVNESDIQSRLKEAQLAQADVAKIRFMNEFAVRRILTPDQLVRFRDLRRQFEQTRPNIEKDRPVNRDRPFPRKDPANAKPLREVKQQLRQVNRTNRQRP